MAEAPRSKLDRSQITDGNKDVWCRKFKVSDEELQALIKKVGNSVEAVRSELARISKKQKQP